VNTQTEDIEMTEAGTKLPVKVGEPTSERSLAPAGWRPLESLRREVDRLFEDFSRGSLRFPFRTLAFDLEPFWRGEVSWATAPAVDVVEKDKGYEITAELPGMDEKNIELTVSGRMLRIKGEKNEEKEEKKKDYHLSERRYGSFERSFGIPEGVDEDKIDASFKKGVLTVTLPKRPEAQKPEKKIAVQSG
jgi:HSP20 family protein